MNGNQEDIRRLEMKEQNTKDALIERDHDTLEELKSLMERSGSPEKRTPAARLEEMYQLPLNLRSAS